MSQESYLVIGGSGFLGRHIVEGLLARGDKNVSVFDIVQRYFDVPCYTGDISNEEELGDAIQKSGATCIFHTAAPVITSPKELFHKVNVLGTKTVIAVAAAYKVPKIVFTSSAGNVYDGTDLIDCDERMPIPPHQKDAYNSTKVQAEKLILEANGKDGLHTCAIRPAGIFGPGDRQLLPGVLGVLRNKQTKIQIGDNCNIFDWTYVTNVVKAHLLAADRLQSTPLPPQSLLTNSLPGIEITTGRHSVPTTAARPPGPTPKLTPKAEESWIAFKEGADESRAFKRSNFDPLSPQSLEIDGEETLQVAGQAFFVTNGEPIYFWDFMRALYFALEGKDTSKEMTIKIPSGLGLVLGTLSEWYSKLVGKEPGFSRQRIYYVTTHRWFNIEKARRVLGYEPDVGIEEGIKKTVEWWKSEEAKKTAAAQKS